MFNGRIDGEAVTLRATPKDLKEIRVTVKKEM